MSTPAIPTASSSYGLAWQRYKQQFLSVFLTGLVVAVASGPVGSGGPDEGATSPLLQLIVGAYALLVLPVIRYGGDWLFLRFIRDEQPPIADIFAGFRRSYLNVVLANLLVVAIIGIGFVLLIVPGIVFACRLAFVSYLVMDRGLEPVAAIQQSWRMTRGRAWTVFGLFVIAIPIALGGLLLLGVGILLALPWIGLAFAALYDRVDLAHAPAD